MSNKAINRVAKNTGILYARMAITVFISLYATRLTLTSLGVEDFGLYNLVGGIILMLGFLNASMSSATQRFMSFAQGERDLEKIKNIFNVSTLLHLCIGIAVVIVLEIAGYFFFNGLLNIEAPRLPIAKIVYQCMIVSSFFTVISVPYEAVITSHENMLFYAIQGILESILKLAIALYITYGSLKLPVGFSYNKQQIEISYEVFDNLIVYSISMGLVSILMLVIRRIYCHINYNECEINFKKYYNKPLMKQISGFAGWYFLVSASSMIANYGQGLMLNIFFGTAINAAQGIASQISGQLGVFAANLLKALNPTIDKSEGAGDRKSMLKTAMIGSKVSFFLLIVLYIPMLLEMPFILKLWLKNVPEFTIIFCQLLLIRNLIEQLFIPINSAILAVGNIKTYQVKSALLFLLPLPFTYILFKFGYPPYVIYIVFSINSIMYAILELYYAKKHCQLSLTKFFSNVIVRCISAFTLVFITSLIPHFLIETNLLRLLSVILTCITSYLIIVFFIGFSYEERVEIKRLASLLLNKFRVKRSLHSNPL